MVNIELETDTLAPLIAGLYCIDMDLDAIGVSKSIWFEVAEKLKPYLEKWDYSKISFEDWIKYCLIIYPLEAMKADDIESLQENTLCWTSDNGNATLFISMDNLPVIEGDDD